MKRRGAKNLNAKSAPRTKGAEDREDAKKNHNIGKQTEGKEHVATKARKHKKRFPEDFMFQLTKDEANILVSQNAIPSKRSLGGYLPYVFTEHGTLMAANVIKSTITIQASIAIVRTFTNFLFLSSAPLR